jgi:hypothetical protein
MRERLQFLCILLCDDCGMPYTQRSPVRSVLTRIAFTKKALRIRRLCPACAEVDRAIIRGTKSSSWLKKNWKTDRRDDRENTRD